MATLVRISKTNAQEAVSKVNAFMSLDRQMRKLGKNKAPKTDEERRLFGAQNSGSFSFLFEEKTVDLTCKTECIGSTVNYVSDFYVNGRKIRSEELGKLASEILDFYGLGGPKFKKTKHANKTHKRMENSIP